VVGVTGGKGAKDSDPDKPNLIFIVWGEEGSLKGGGWEKRLKKVQEGNLTKLV